ncbi:hypothetical protein HPB48_026851 [Haemaphysalis longicornis]|uniref:Uncharacterized protein n=1 Tax=Haemaphysalis longicornis TaxID=44386 RepID=A0A9J6HDD7_HAELO|nr:hypothetical protein HPB48_026851 [Haemaphysalis longicornis]
MPNTTATTVALPPTGCLRCSPRPRSKKTFGASQLSSLHSEAFRSPLTVKIVQLYRAKEDDWLTVLRKNQHPQNQSTLVLPPQDGFLLATHRRAALMMAIESAANLLQTQAKAIYFDVPRHLNIPVIKVRTLATAPEDSCRGIIHGIEAGTSPEELMQNLCAPDTDVPSGRMTGRSETELLTFRRTYVPRFVLYHRAKYDCKPYKKKAQLCFTCYGIGRQTDSCPQAGVIQCQPFGSLLDTPG